MEEVEWGGEKRGRMAAEAGRSGVDAGAAGEGGGNRDSPSTGSKATEGG